MENNNKKTCPITGLKITTNPDWENNEYVKNYWVSFKIIEDNILVCEARGKVDIHGLKKALILSKKIIDENFNNEPFVYIENLLKVVNTTTEGRKYYIKYMNGLENINSLIYYGANPLLKFTVKLAKKIKIINFTVFNEKNYSEAIKLALKNLGIKKSITFNNRNLKVSFDDFTIRFEIIDGNILHIIPDGIFRKKYIAKVFEFQANLIKNSLQDKLGKYYYVVNLNKTAITRECRIEYVKVIQLFYKEFPFVSYMYYGANRLINMAVAFSKPFTSFELRKLNSLDDLLELKKSKKKSELKKSDFVKKKPDLSNETQSYIDEFLVFLAKIDWENESIDNDFKKNTTHPFYQVYDAITLIKSDLDELYLEKKKNEEEKALLQNKLQKSLKLETMGKLAGSVAHDLNNVLSGIVSYPDIILKELPSNKKNEKAIKYIKRMKNSGIKAADIVQDLLTLSRSGVVSFAKTNLNSIIIEYLNSPEFNKLSASNLKISVKTYLSEDLKNISASSIHLSKTVMNLIINAYESISNEGEIKISTENICFKDKQIKGYEKKINGDYIELIVSDTGSGISKQDLPKIFEPFYSKKIMGRSGTGLGMMVIKGTVDDHSGFLCINSEENKGSEFKLYFPVNNEDVDQKTFKKINDYTGKGESILVIDDVEDQRIIAYKLLKGMHYSVKTVSSGEEAIEYLKKENADLLVLDMIMEPGIGGLETYRQIKNIKPDQKAIIVSGYSKTEDVIEVQKLGAGKYIRKPYTIEELGIAVFEELNK